MSEITTDYAKLKDSEILSQIATVKAGLEAQQAVEETDPAKQALTAIVIRGLTSDLQALEAQQAKRLRKAGSEIREKIAKAAKGLVSLVKRSEKVKQETVSIEIIPAAEQAQAIAKQREKASKVEPIGPAILAAIAAWLDGGPAGETKQSLEALRPNIGSGQTLRLVDLPRGTIIGFSEAWTAKYQDQLDKINAGLAIHVKHWKAKVDRKAKVYRLTIPAKARAKIRKAVKDQEVKIGKKSIANHVYTGEKVLEGQAQAVIDRLLKVGSIGLASHVIARGGSRSWPQYLALLVKRYGLEVSEVPEPEAKLEPEADVVEQAKNGSPVDRDANAPEPAKELATAKAVAEAEQVAAKAEQAQEQEQAKQPESK